MIQNLKSIFCTRNARRNFLSVPLKCLPYTVCPRIFYPAKKREPQKRSQERKKGRVQCLLTIRYLAPPIRWAWDSGIVWGWWTWCLQPRRCRRGLAVCSWRENSGSIRAYRKQEEEEGGDDSLLLYTPLAKSRMGGTTHLQREKDAQEKHNNFLIMQSTEKLLLIILKYYVIILERTLFCINLNLAHN